MDSRRGGAPSRRTVKRCLHHLALTGMVVVAGAMPTSRDGEVNWSAEVLVVNLVASVVLIVRHRFPRTVLAVVVALAAASVPLGLFSPASSIAVAVATYTVALYLPRGPSGSTALAAGAAMALLAFAAGDAIAQHALVVLLGGAIGEAIRTQRAHLAAITERAERAERTREAVAHQRVAEDRLGIARDLHDVVAHQIAVINLHAGAASAALRTRPDDADASLAIIRNASRTVLTEIGDLLATLRDPRSVDAGLPGIAQLDDVVRGFAGLGLEVTVRTTGDSGDLPSAVDVAAFRIVQEALTNAHKHGSGHRAHVLIEHLPTAVRLVVSNPVEPSGTAAAAIGTRQGLVGMAERVASLRGSLSSGLVGLDRWELVAELPTGTRPPQPAEPAHQGKLA